MTGGRCETISYDGGQLIYGRRLREKTADETLCGVADREVLVGVQCGGNSDGSSSTNSTRCMIATPAAVAAEAGVGGREGGREYRGIGASACQEWLTRGSNLDPLLTALILTQTMTMSTPSPPPGAEISPG